MLSAERAHTSSSLSSLTRRSRASTLACALARNFETLVRFNSAAWYAAVVGEPHPVMGEVPRACVVLRRPVESAELERYMRERLADYKVPRTYTVLTELPRNALGKVLKRELREAAR